MARSDSSRQSNKPTETPWASLFVRTGVVAAYWLTAAAVAHLELLTERHRRRRPRQGMLKRGKPAANAAPQPPQGDAALVDAAKKLGIPEDKLQEMLKDGRLGVSVKRE